MFDKFIEILCRYINLDIRYFEPDMRITDYCDTLDMLEMIVDIEQEFGIEIPGEMVEAYHTVSQLWAYINKEADK